VLTQWLFDGEELILRIVCAAMVSFAIVMLMSPRVIRFLVRKKLGDRPEFDHAALNQLTRHKSATPTMGGLLIVPAIFAASFLFADVRCSYVSHALFALVWLGVLGGVDDWLKLRRSARLAAGQQVGTREGLKMHEKVLFQVALAVLLAIFTYRYGSRTFLTTATTRPATVNAAHSFYLLFKSEPIPMPMLAYVIVTVLVMVGSSNAVNLTDGMDGLAGGCVAIVTTLFLALAWVAGKSSWAELLGLPFVPYAAELSVVCAAIVGACLGFLWFNCLPAQVFMGDTGSLPLGGVLGYMAVVTRNELILFVAGGVFVAEAASVLAQVSYFKATGGKRLFLCAPIHHHFHLKGWAESKVVVRFWLATILLAAVALATLKLR